ncbi:hypothetical protein [Bacillus sp. FSL L8-0152]|uniref:hypothetical protein n=1 Tax=Bacillus sp. FSL L8-0152 TaxID=2921516 RepID=UPI0030FA248D
MHNKENSVYQHNDTPDYRRLIIESSGKYPDDRFADLNYVKENGTNHDYIMYLIETVQQELLNKDEEKYTFSVYEIRKFLEGMTYAVNHVAPNAAIAHERMISKSEIFLIKCLENMLEGSKRS